MTGKIWTIANGKGGVGKTSIAVSIAVALQNDYDQSVVYFDADPGEGASGHKWATLRENSKHDLSPISWVRLSGSSILPNIFNLAKQFEHVVVDTGGFKSPEMMAAMSAADALIVPFTTDGFATQWVDAMDSYIETINSNREVMQMAHIERISGLITRVPTNSNDRWYSNTRSILEKSKYMKPLKSKISHLHGAWNSVTNTGAGVTELDSNKATEQLQNVITEVAKEWLK